MVDEDGGIDHPLTLQDMDASSLDSTANQWAEFLADVDNEHEEEEFDLLCFKYRNGLSQENVPEATQNPSEQLEYKSSRKGDFTYRHPPNLASTVPEEQKMRVPRYQG
jgi:hypothetical protein